jgi:osmotically-inducible protein OsmY
MGLDMRITEQLTIVAACSLVTFVLGCQPLRNEATVKIPTSESAQDEVLSKAVRDRLVAAKSVNLSGVKVVSRGGTTYLAGTVTSLDARDQAVRIAWNTPGVQSVVNALEVAK